MRRFPTYMLLILFSFSMLSSFISASRMAAEYGYPGIFENLSTRCGMEKGQSFYLSEGKWTDVALLPKSCTTSVAQYADNERCQ